MKNYVERLGSSGRYVRFIHLRLISSGISGASHWLKKNIAKRWLWKEWFPGKQWFWQTTFRGECEFENSFLWDVSYSSMEAINDRFLGQGTSPSRGLPSSVKWWNWHGGTWRKHLTGDILWTLCQRYEFCTVGDVMCPSTCPPVAQDDDDDDDHDHDHTRNISWRWRWWWRWQWRWWFHLFCMAEEMDYSIQPTDAQQTTTASFRTSCGLSLPILLRFHACCFALVQPLEYQCSAFGGSGNFFNRLSSDNGKQ